jgi:hypothetical protein
MSLAGTAYLKLGPTVLGTLVKHYVERLTAQKLPSTTSDGVPQDGKQVVQMLNDDLRQEELLYDLLFTLVKVSSVRVRPHGSTAMRH